MALSAWLSDAMAGAAKTSAAPKDEKVQALPQSIDRLHKQITVTQGELVQAQCEQGKIELAREKVLGEIAEALEANASQQREIQGRLDALREQWVAVSHQVGVKAEVVRRGA